MKTVHKGYIAAAVILTLFSVLIVYFIRLDIAFDEYRQVNHLREISHNFLWWSYSEPADVSIQDLSNINYYWGVLVVSLSILFLYPLIGRIISGLSIELEKLYIWIYNIDIYDQIIHITGSEKNYGFEFGSIWPVSVFYTIYLIVANIVGLILKLFW